VNRKEILVNLMVTGNGEKSGSYSVNVSANIFFPHICLELILCDRYVHKRLHTTVQYVVSLVGQVSEDE
jgi:hypothetical protein